MSRAARTARWAAFVLTALLAADAAVALVGWRLPGGGPEPASIALPRGRGGLARSTTNARTWTEPIRERNLLRADVGDEPDTDVTTSALDVTEDDLPETGLDGYELVGTAVASRPTLSYAIVSNRREQDVYQIGEELGDAEIVGIHANRVVLNRHGRTEQLSLDVDAQGGSGRGRGKAGARTAVVSDDDNIQVNPDGSYSIDSGFVDDQLQNLAQLFTQVRAVPNFKDGKADGFRLFSIKRGSIFDKIGLKNGDVIHQINEYELNDPRGRDGRVPGPQGRPRLRGHGEAQQPDGDLLLLRSLRSPRCDAPSSPSPSWSPSRLRRSPRPIGPPSPIRRPSATSSRSRASRSRSSRRS